MYFDELCKVIEAKAEVMIDLEDAQDRIKQLEAALEAVEWRGRDIYRDNGEMVHACPCCDLTKAEGHSVSCDIATALNRTT